MALSPRLPQSKVLEKDCELSSQFATKYEPSQDWTCLLHHLPCLVVAPEFIDTQYHSQTSFGIKMALRDGVTSALLEDAGAPVAGSLGGPLVEAEGLTGRCISARLPDGTAGGDVSPFEPRETSRA